MRIQITPIFGVVHSLYNNPDPERVPCHRVVDRNGKLAENYAFAWSAENRPLRHVRTELKSRKGRLGGEGWRQQKRKLIEEGVIFKDKKHADMEKCLWKKKFDSLL